MENKEKLLEYLRSFDVIILSTTNGEKPYACPVFYGVDDTFNFYIVTSPESIHGKYFTHNNNVSCVVVDTTQKNGSGESRIGTQIQATIQEITDSEAMEHALLVWSKGDSEKVKNFLSHIHDNTWKTRVYHIKPHTIKWINEELYGNEGSQIFTF